MVPTARLEPTVIRRQAVAMAVTLATAMTRATTCPLFPVPMAATAVRVAMLAPMAMAVPVAWAAVVPLALRVPMAFLVPAEPAVDLVAMAVTVVTVAAVA